MTTVTFMMKLMTAQSCGTRASPPTSRPTASITVVDSGLLERRPYSRRLLRSEHRLMAADQDFRTVLWALLAWCNRHLAPEGPSVVVVDRISGAVMTHPAFPSARAPTSDNHSRARHATRPDHSRHAGTKATP
jgi:hypothetical protein